MKVGLTGAMLDLVVTPLPSSRHSEDVQWPTPATCARYMYAENSCVVLENQKPQ